MTTIGAVLAAHLENNGPVSDIVGDAIFTRKPPKQAAPYITYRRVSTRRLMTHDGPGLRGPRFEFSCWAADETAARALGRAVANAFDLVSTSEFRSLIENELESVQTDAALPRTIVDVRVWFVPELEAAS